MTVRELLFWRWLRDVSIGIMTISAAISGFRFEWLPSYFPDYCAFSTAIAGGLSTFAAGRMPSSKDANLNLKKGAGDGDV